jgi:hypothetical protein
VAEGTQAAIGWFRKSVMLPIGTKLNIVDDEEEAEATPETPKEPVVEPPSAEPPKEDDSVLSSLTKGFRRVSVSFNSLINTDKKEETDDLKATLNDTQDKLNERGERLNEMENKTAELENQAGGFATKAKEVAEAQAKKKWWQL